MAGFERLRMEIDLAGRDLSWPAAPPGFRLTAWCPSLLETIYFRGETFFSELTGCQRPGDIPERSWLAIVSLFCEFTAFQRPGFIPEASLLAIDCKDNAPCGVIVGVRDRTGLGLVENLGVASAYRGRGLGTALMLNALDGFLQVGLHRAFLEVTTENRAAIRLYQRLGWRIVVPPSATAAAAPVASVMNDRTALPSAEPAID